MSQDETKIITASNLANPLCPNPAGIPDMTGKSRSNFMAKSFYPNETGKYQRDVSPNMTSLSFHNYHPQPNMADASKILSKFSYRTPHEKVAQMNLDQLAFQKAKEQQDEHDEILSKYEKLYEMEKKHQNDIKVNNQYSLVDYDQGKVTKKLRQNNETRQDLRKQIEEKQAELLRKAEADRLYGDMCEDTLGADMALVSIYPPIKVTPVDEEREIKKQNQRAYMIELQEAVKIKRELAVAKKEEERVAQRKANKEYTEAVEARLAREKVERHEQNIRCINECDALIKTKNMAKRVMQDNDDFRYAVLHDALYQGNTSLSPLKTVPREGFVQKLAETIEFPRAADAGDQVASTKINVESGNVLWGYPLNSEAEQKKRAAACDKDMKETVERIKAGNLKANFENEQSPSPERTLDADASPEDEQRNTLNFTPVEKELLELNDQDMQDIRDLKNELNEDGENIDEVGPLSPSLARSVRPDGQNSIIPKKLNSKRLGDLNSQEKKEIKRKQQSEVDSIFEHQTQFSSKRSTYQKDEVKTKLLTATQRADAMKALNDTKSLAQITKETLTKIREEKRSVKDVFSTDKKTQAINSLMIKNKIGEYQSKLFGTTDSAAMGQKLTEETNMNGAQLDALKRFFVQLEDTAINDKLKTDNALGHNIEFDNSNKNEAILRRISRKQDDKVNTQLKASKLARDRDWKDQVYKQQGIEGNQGYPRIGIPSYEQVCQQKYDQQNYMKDLLDEQVNNNQKLNSLYQEDQRKTTNQLFATRSTLTAQPEKLDPFNSTQRNYSQDATNQLQNALKISMNIQENKRQQQLKQMQNIKDVWQKTQKIRQLRSMFTQEFGTCINGDKVIAAQQDPNRNKSLLSSEHIVQLKKDQQNSLAASIAAKRALSSRGFEKQFRVESQTNPTFQYLNAIQLKNAASKQGTPHKRPNQKLDTISVGSAKSQKQQDYRIDQQSRLAMRIEANLVKQKEINEQLNNEYNYEMQSHDSKSTKMSNFLRDANSKKGGPDRNSQFYKTTSVFQKNGLSSIKKAGPETPQVNRVFSPKSFSGNGIFNTTEA